MGSSFVSVVDNVPVLARDFVLSEVYRRLRSKPVVEATHPVLFRREYFPSPDMIRDVDVGVDGTRKSVVRFNDGSWIVFEGTVRTSTIARLASMSYKQMYGDKR